MVNQMEYLGRCIRPSSVTTKEEFVAPYEKWNGFALDGDPESSVGDDLWRGGLSTEQMWREALVTEERASDVYDRLSQLPLRWELAHFRGEKVFFHFLEAMPESAGALTDLRRWFHTGIDSLARASYSFTRLIDAVCERRYAVLEQGQLVAVHPPAVFSAMVRPSQKTLHDTARELLEAANEPLDDWHREIVIAHLLCPRLALFAIGQPWWLTAPLPGETDLERQAATAVGSVMRVEQHAVRMKLESQKVLGKTARRAKSGPKATTTRRTNPRQEDFERAVMSKRHQGVSAHYVAQNAEIQRLYRQWKGEDHTSPATEATIWRVERKLSRHDGKQPEPE